MNVRNRTLLLVAFALPCLAGCINDAASLQIDGKEHSISLVREQHWLWDKQMELSVVVSRMPDCQRRHRLRNTNIGSSTVEVFSLSEVSFLLRQGARLYFVETETCESFRELERAPAEGLGRRLGRFVEVEGRYIFEGAR